MSRRQGGFQELRGLGLSDISSQVGEMDLVRSPTSIIVCLHMKSTTGSIDFTRRQEMNKFHGPLDRILSLVSAVRHFKLK